MQRDTRCKRNSIISRRGAADHHRVGSRRSTREVPRDKTGFQKPTTVCRQNDRITESVRPMRVILLIRSSLVTHACRRTPVRAAEIASRSSRAAYRASSCIRMQPYAPLRNPVSLYIARRSTPVSSLYLPFRSVGRSVSPPSASTSAVSFRSYCSLYAPRARIYIRLRSTISHTGLMLMHTRIRARIRNGVGARLVITAGRP